MVVSLIYYWKSAVTIFHFHNVSERGLTKLQIRKLSEALLGLVFSPVGCD
jgi:hypothetical protein